MFPESLQTGFGSNCDIRSEAKRYFQNIIISDRSVAVVTWNFILPNSFAVCLKTGPNSKISYRYRINFEIMTSTHLYVTASRYCEVQYYKMLL